MRRDDEHTIPFGSKTRCNSDGSLIGIFHIGAPEQLIEDDKEFFPGSAPGRPFSPAAPRHKNDCAHAQIYRQVDRRINAIEHGELHFSAATGKAHMRRNSAMPSDFMKVDLPAIFALSEKAHAVRRYPHGIGNSLFQLQVIHPFEIEQMAVLSARR